MCCICGVASDEPDGAHPSRPTNAALVCDMLARTRHRGPDGCGVHVRGKVFYAGSPEGLAEALPREAGDAPVVLGQSRLAITGSMAASQPFVSRDGKIAMAHNGEVYNHAALRALIDDPESATTGSDSEVLMRVLEHHYRACDQRLPEAMRRTVATASGMYALAATDGEVVVLARDAIGKKPLYYVHGPTRFAWASERKALVDVAREQDAPIRRVRPGEMVTREPGLPPRLETVERTAKPAVDITDHDQAVEAYRRALDQAIQRRTRGLERAAVLFSGGVDSVLVARLLQRAGVRTTGYVCGVADSGDVRYALEVAEEMGLPVKVVPVDEAVVQRELPTILEATELHGPLMAEVSVPMWFASKAAHEDGHRVIFTGQAADELFAGYDWYRDVLRDDGPLTLHARMWEDILALPLDTLEREDRITMAWSMEMRAPFLDADVIRVAMRIAPTVKIHGEHDDQRKHPHRDLAMQCGVPRSVAYREKQPAQDGANIHVLLQRIAARWFTGEVPDSDVPDFGSLYRYRERRGKYTSPAVAAMLEAMVQQRGFVVAGEDGSAHAPPLGPVARRTTAASGRARR